MPSVLSTRVEIDVSAIVTELPAASVNKYVPSILSTRATVPAAALISSIASCTLFAVRPEVLLSYGLEEAFVSII